MVNATPLIASTVMPRGIHSPLHFTLVRSPPNAGFPLVIDRLFSYTPSGEYAEASMLTFSYREVFCHQRCCTCIGKKDWL